MKKILSLAALAVSITAACAVGFDLYGPTRTLVFCPPQNFAGNSANLITNNPVDVRAFEGVCIAQVSVYTNTGTTGGALTFQMYQSTDKTNWTPVINYSIGTNYTAVQTNIYYGSTNLLATNNYILPINPIAPTVASAGFANTYGLAQPFTNTGALTVSAGGVYNIGFSVDDTSRYIEGVWSPAGGTITNYTGSATFIGFPKYGTGQGF